MPDTSPPPDRNFDGIAQRFARNIYDSPKGRLRLELCWRELEQRCPVILGPEPLQVWDAGGGLGQIAAKLAARGHEVLLNDLSAEMLAMAEQQLALQAPAGRVTLRQEAIQTLAAEPANFQRFDLVLCHAVLEWVQEPRALIAGLFDCLRPGGQLSLMFYNLNALVLVNMSKGNLYKLRDEDFAGHPGGLTPPAPRRPQDVIADLEGLGMEIVARRGLRLSYDLLPRRLRAERSLEDLLEIDWQYGDREPFWALGRYVHLLCRKPESGES